MPAERGGREARGSAAGRPDDAVLGADLRLPPQLLHHHGLTQGPEQGQEEQPRRADDADDGEIHK